MFLTLKAWFCKTSAAAADLASARGRPSSSSVLGRWKISGENSSQRNVGQRGCRRLIRKVPSVAADASPSARPHSDLLFTRAQAAGCCCFFARPQSRVMYAHRPRFAIHAATRFAICASHVPFMPKHSRLALFANRLLHSRVRKLRA
jgi:hypothetical protein